MKQSVTSANTSINSKRLPAIYGKIHLNEGDRVLDQDTIGMYRTQGNLLGYNNLQRRE